VYPEDSFEFAPVEREPFDAGMFLAGVLTGAAIGAAVALLFAPQSGEEMRHEIADAGMHLKDRVSSSYSSVADRTSSTVEEARSALGEWVSHTRQALDDTRQRLDEAVDAGRTAYAEKKTELDAQVDASLDA